MKPKGLETCFICNRRVGVKKMVKLDGRYVCRHHHGVQKEIERYGKLCNYTGAICDPDCENYENGECGAILLFEKEAGE